METGNKKENMRDYASVEQLIVLINLESMNAELIKQNLPQTSRLQRLRKMAYEQLEAISNSNTVSRLSTKTKLLENN